MKHGVYPSVTTFEWFMVFNTWNKGHLTYFKRLDKAGNHGIELRLNEQEDYSALAIYHFGNKLKERGFAVLVISIWIKQYLLLAILFNLIGFPPLFLFFTD